MIVGGPTSVSEGVPLTWSTATPIQYRVDSGPMSSNGSTVVISNEAGLTRVQSLFGHWQSVPTTSISYSYAGAIQATGSFTGGDVQTLAQFDAVAGSCDSGVQSPIIFDATGSLISALGYDPSSIIGFAGLCAIDTATGHIVSGLSVLNGKFQDGVSSSELTAAQFDEAMTHEFGHFSGLDHAQINVDVFNETPCNADTLAGLPLMFPIAYCQARSDVGLPILSPDDKAWISKLYPGASFNTSYGTISGVILFSDGLSHVQGVNVIARRVDDSSTPANESRTIAVSVVSGYLFTWNPGQPVTGDNEGSSMGSRSPSKIGYYEIPVPPGTYTVEVESINQGFDEGSSVGPLDPPVPSPGQSEFWSDPESAFDTLGAKDPITVAPGQTVNGINIILNGTQPRFDQFEDGGADLLRLPAFENAEEAVRA